MRKIGMERRTPLVMRKLRTARRGQAGSDGVLTEGDDVDLEVDEGDELGALPAGTWAK